MNVNHQTRDHFHAGAVLKGLRENTIPPEELPRLLEECCHALERERETKRQFLDHLSNMQKTLSR